MAKLRALRSLLKHWSVVEEREYFTMRHLKVPLKLLSSLLQLKTECETGRANFLLLPQRQDVFPLSLGEKQGQLWGLFQLYIAV